MTDSFTERVLPSAAAWLLAPAGGILAGIALLPASAWAALTAFLVITATIAVVLVLLSPTIRVSEQFLVVDRARLPLDVVGPVQRLEGGDLKEAMGPGLDARAHVRFRAWARSAVRITVVDAADPTPYWLISTRHPDTLDRALRGGE
ncbi:DUF3093 domain-containing protein [Ruania halotolerans]|uniref:DUF3093 domain-containing protein n=1 Tax=Ruania halotolerans TaxID=2897773 RepID=UPI001E34317E|nr:DUF3093 domain-containing protein [Ruania halotolerans]UFU04804.1 DUF3093 domain-containing protein [Ruania halotolerans]